LRAADLEAHRAVLLRFALAHLRDAAAAEDAVQDTLLAALQAAPSFRGESSVRTWLIGILKRKLVDRLRTVAREVPLTATGDAGDPDDGAALDRLFDQAGHWSQGPVAWGDPHAALEQDGFWSALEDCLTHLPARTGRVFVLRELIGLEPDEVCKECGMSASNYWVTMHRARLRLRACLEQRWFATGGRE
jgi:RNA polymerase sigma-70 factor (ECF subfamily)